MYNIIQGSRTDSPANPFVVLLKTDAETMNPFDLTAVTEVETCFQNTDGTELTAKLTTGEIEVIGNPILGKLGIVLDAAETALLAVTEGATLELAITTTGDPFKVQIPLAYSVAQSDC